MNNQDKSEVQLLKEFQELQQAYESLKDSVEPNLREHKRTEDALRKSEEKYRQLIENSHDIIYTLTLEGVFMFVSSAWKSIIGHPIEEILGKNIRLFLHPDDLPRCLAFLQQVIDTGKPQQGIEYRVQSLDGSWSWHTSNIVPIRDEAGRVIGAEGIARDITERRKAQDLLEQTQQNYETFFHTIDDFLFVLDDKGVILYCNDTVTRRLGYTKEELTGLSILMVHPPERREEAAQTTADMLRGVSKFCPIPLLTKTGTQIPVETRVIRGIWNGKPAIFGITKDISKLQLSQEKFSKVFYLNPCASGLSDLETGQYIEVNDQFYSLLGYDKNEVIGKTALELGILTAESAKSILQNANSDGKLINVEADLKAKNGDIKHVLMSAENIFVQDKKYRYTVVHDVTERKKAEEELIIAKERAEKSYRLKSTFLANMSHEIRTPMNGILGFAEILKDPDLTKEEQRQYLNIIEESGIRMLNIINDIIDISKIEAGLMKIKLTESDLNEQINYIYTFFKPEVEAKGMKLYFKKSLPKHEAMIVTDREKLYAILTNLVKNAIKYSKEGTIEIGCSKKDDTVEFYVKDTGIGIPKGKLKAVFERFIQLDSSDEMAFQGSGLGLSITRAYVTMLGGTIWVESEEGRGSTFYFTLPCKPVSAKESGMNKDKSEYI